MKRFGARPGVAAIWLALILAVMASGCRLAPIYNVQDEPLKRVTGQALTQKQVEQAIVRACESLGWRPKVVSAGNIVTTLQVRGHVAVADIKYTKDKFSIIYKDSQNLDAQAGQIHENYNGWVKRLEQRIRTEVSLL